MSWGCSDKLKDHSVRLLQSIAFRAGQAALKNLKITGRCHPFADVHSSEWDLFSVKLNFIPVFLGMPHGTV